MMRNAVLLLASFLLCNAVRAEFVELHIQPQDAKQYFTAYAVQSLHPVDWLAWANEQSSVLDHIVNTILGVHPCSYQSWGPVQIWPAYDVDYLDDEDEEGYEAVGSYDYSADEKLGRRFGLFNNGNKVAQQEANRELFTGDVEVEDLDDVLVAGSGAQEDSQQMWYTAQGRAVPLSVLEHDAAVINNILAIGGSQKVKSQMALESAMQRVHTDHVMDAGFVDGVEVEEVGFWEDMRSASAWGVMLFLVLVAACLLVWGAFINTCFALRDPAYSQFIAEQHNEDNTLLEPLCQNDFQQPEVIYRTNEYTNPAYRRQ